MMAGDNEDGEDIDDEEYFSPAKAVNPEKRLEEMVAEAVKQLVDEGLAEDRGVEDIESTDYGDMLCQYSIRFATFLSLKNMEKGASPQQLVSSRNWLLIIVTDSLFAVSAARTDVQSCRVQGHEIQKWREDRVYGIEQEE